MNDKPIWEQIGSGFVNHYYQVFDADRGQLGSLYIDASCLSWEGQQFQGKTAIVDKLLALPFRKIQHSITAQDHQPTPDSCILSMVVGQLQSVFWVDIGLSSRFHTSIKSKPPDNEVGHLSCIQEGQPRNQSRLGHDCPHGSG
ncbi:nuclear transport factor 2 isoform X1 [Chiloscyllium plagiosum]|uniref:nuclear transport factor 2 isoform X1 n=1 Tax=Chiloscyllium plagiosum TaxID=36176 RepID=UPI001CB85831|nr:nuclear transport factor 2 isoform X1 [Chiloscyllium plagiosum]XP_043563020.1 nuclear transport factor 2 isoform X1 [Chiloscyllium plagiosum]XP_043563021.1 nuclear transport factor 2 isoform X1 [Chiloscyllium plagiosum]XP_043563022.1 nuclear transport factor 2 isoform X1 [Chiloscyllium plagiosum]XP_043563023.1 nuclear transport factor 2 isoform X1 [Chiloscyllium plagiosum]XP_043563024.1 nuclear transport factor 2 isoform X1 [Chiloscyllium plagiosum]